MELEFREDQPVGVTVADQPLVVNLDGTVRQVSVAQVNDEGKPDH